MTTVQPRLGQPVEQKNLCPQCQGPLRDRDGIYFQRLIEDRRSAKVVNECRTCHEKRLKGQA